VELSQPDATAVYKILAYLFPRLEHPMPARYRADAETPRVHLDEYFDRYFMFTLPVGDISDVAAASDVRALLDTGALPPNGMLRRSLDNGPAATKRLALSKLHREIDKGVESSTSTDLLFGALSELKPSLLNDHGDLPWLSDQIGIAVMLFHQALRVSSDPRDAVNRLRRLFDLYGTTAILAFLRAGQDEYATDVAAAIRDVRAEVLDVCMQDFVQDTPHPDGQVLGFLDFLSPEMFSELRHRIDAEGVTQHQVAARFVAQDSDWRDGLSQSFYQTPFLAIFPLGDIDVSQFPPAVEEHELPEREDRSIEARLTKAAYVIRQMFPGSAPATGP